MIPYVPETTPMTGEEQEALIRIFEEAHWYTPTHRLRLANDIIRAGFRRRVPKKVSRFQLWSYAIETILVAYCAAVVFGTGEFFVYGALCSLTLGTLLTFIDALIINHGIKTGAIK
jgi:hypothetical protein